MLAPAVLLGNAGSGRGEVKLAGIFGNGMVLQRDMNVPVWGTAGAGELVTVRFQQQRKSVAAGKDGKWQVKLDPLKAGGPHELMVTGKNTVKLTEVLVGEVWVC